MKRILGWSAVAIAILTAGAKLSTPAKAITDEQIIRQLTEQSLKAHDAKDDVTLDKLEADDFDVLSEAGVKTKQDQLKGVRSSKNSAVPITRSVENQKIRIYGDAAIVTQLDHASASGGSSSYQSTFVWVRHGGEWKLVHLHYTQVN